MTQLSVTAFDQPVTMNSREIAELVNKRHDNVKRTIETLVEQEVIVSPQIEEIPTATKPMRVYVFTGEQGKRDSIVVVAQLSPEFTARLVDRWQELEAQAIQQAISKTMPEALRLAAEAIEQRDQLAKENTALQGQLAIAAPKADALQRIAVADGSVCIQSAAKHPQMRPKDLFRWLQEHQWIYRRAGGSGWLGHQSRIQSGLLEHKVTTVWRSDGSEKMAEQCRITPRGLAKLGELLSKAGIGAGACLSPSPGGVA